MHLGMFIDVELYS